MECCGERVRLYIINRYMAAILIHLDEATLKALNQVAPAAKRQRAEFIRRAIKKAIRDQEYARIREGYLQKPDLLADADDWSTAEEFA